MITIIYDEIACTVESFPLAQSLLKALEIDRTGGQLQPWQEALIEKAIREADTKVLARILGQAGGDKGGAARAAKLSAERRNEIAKVAANKRWANRRRDG